MGWGGERCRPVSHKAVRTCGLCPMEQADGLVWLCCGMCFLLSDGTVPGDEVRGAVVIAAGAGMGSRQGAEGTNLGGTGFG